MARVMFSFREERLVCEADPVPTVSVLGPRALEVKNVTMVWCEYLVHRDYRPDFLFLDHLRGRVDNKPEVGDHHQAGGAANEHRHRGVAGQGDHKGED